MDYRREHLKLKKCTSFHIWLKFLLLWFDKDIFIRIPSLYYRRSSIQAFILIFVLLDIFQMYIIILPRTQRHFQNIYFPSCGKYLKFIFTYFQLVKYCIKASMLQNNYIYPHFFEQIFYFKILFINCYSCLFHNGHEETSLYIYIFDLICLHDIIMTYTFNWTCY